MPQITSAAVMPDPESFMERKRERVLWSSLVRRCRSGANATGDLKGGHDFFFKVKIQSKLFQNTSVVDWYTQMFPPVNRYLFVLLVRLFFSGYLLIKAVQGKHGFDGVDVVGVGGRKR